MAPKKPLKPQTNPDETGIVVSKFAGLKNTVRPERLGPDELERAINVDLDDVGQLHRRRGYDQFGDWTNRCHSLFTAADGRTFVAYEHSGGWSLIWVKPDGIHTGIGSAPVTRDRISYAQVGPKIYYSSVSANGIIDVSGAEPTYGPWGSGPDEFFSPVSAPTATLPAIKGYLRGKPPLARYITYSNGRIYLAVGNVVWFTELFDYLHVNKTRGFWQFEGEITMLASTTTDIYVGTNEGCWFVGGTIAEPKRVRVMDSPVIPGSLIYVPSELANPPQVPLNQDTQVKVSVMFMTTAGICGGQDDGVVYNFTENKVVFPRAIDGAAMFRRQDGVNQYVVATNSGGVPTSNARLGDYVDAEIRRGGASWKEVTETIQLGDRFTVYINGLLSP